MEDDEEEEEEEEEEEDEELEEYAEKVTMQVVKKRPSSRIRCADKILTQLEIHAEAELYFGGNEKKRGNKAVLKTWTEQVRTYVHPRCI